MNSAATSDPAETANPSFFRQLTEYLGVAVVATDADLVIQVWNAAAARMFGAAGDRMIGAPVSSIVPQERRRLAERIFARVLRTGETADFEFQHRDAQGNRQELIVTIAPVLSEMNLPIGISLSLRDITRRIALQNELSESRKMRAMGDMANSVAHHFNNILGGIITGIDYAKGSDDPAVVAKVLDQTSRALLRATALVHGLLTFSEGGRCSEDLSDLTEILYELADEVERNPPAKAKIDLVVNVTGLPVLPVARGRVQTILRNLIQNAVEAMPEGGTIRLEAALENDWIVLAVSDTGRGMDDATQSRLFEPFWTTKSPSDSNPSRVRGLGLPIVYGLVQVLGGSIAVHSEPGMGTCVRIRLPRPESS
jgi:PAS domain S-box-containing protein